MTSASTLASPSGVLAALARLGRTAAPDAGIASGQFEIARRDVAEVALVSGLLGAFLGIASGWQVNIESAQVVAGVVQYPVDNPFAMYHLKTWTLLHQVPAALLACGVPERVLAMIVGGLAGAISFVALALCALALGAQRWFAALVPVLLLGTMIYGEIGSIYPVRVLSNAAWVLYGCVGTSLAVLVWALLSVGQRRLGLFLMGLAPAIHPTMGAWCLSVGGLALLWSWKSDGLNTAQQLRRGAGWLFAGLSIATVSLCVHWYLSRNVPTIPAELKAAYIDTFTANWDSHRKAFPLDHLVILLASLGIVTCGVWLSCFAKSLPSDTRFLLRAVFLSATFGLALCVATQWQERLPTVLLMAMPGRYINVAGLALPAIWLGMLYRNRPTLLGHAVLLALVAQIVIRVQVLHVGLFYVPFSSWLLLGAVLAMLAQARHLAVLPMGEHAWLMHLFHYLAPLGLAAMAARVALDDPQIGAELGCLLAATLLLRRWSTSAGFAAAIGWFEIVLMSLLALGPVALVEPRAASVILLVGMATLTLYRRFHFTECRPIALRGLAVASVVLVAGAFCYQAAEAYPNLYNWENHPVYAAASRGSGFLLTSSNLRATQLRTRRPVLLEGPALNQLPYVPESGPAMNHILKNVYGEDLFEARPADVPRAGGLHRLSGFVLWENRTLAEWQALAREFGFTQVMTSDVWQLQLPVVASYKKLLLYDVPAAETTVATPPAPVDVRLAGRNPSEPSAEID